MDADIMQKIRQRQALALVPRTDKPAKHQPEMLYIGCIDARLDPVADIGIEQGKALIHRTIGAVVAGLDEQGKPRHLSEAASVEFAVNVMKVKHIVVSAHTNCGGLGTCLRGDNKPETSHLTEYLEPLLPVREAVLEHPGEEEAHAHAMEEGSVRQSIDNLRTYPFVAEAEKRGELQLHGWVIDTATKLISEMNPQTLQFKPMAAARGTGAGPGR